MENFCPVRVAEGAHASGQRNCSCQELFHDDSMGVGSASSQELFKDIPRNGTL